MRILITGASGFVGSFLCEEAIKRGMETWAGMRSTSSRKWLQQERLNFAFLDLTRREVLLEQLRAYQKRVGRWDVVIHAAGATKCLKREDFDLHNFQCTRNLVECLEEMDMSPKQFLYVSSLSAGTPNTAYGESKRKSEEWLNSHKQLSIAIFRPTGIYGPREKDYYLMAKGVKQHVDFGAGREPQKITFIYVRDFVKAVFSAIGKEPVVTGKTYTLSDGSIYSSRDFTDLVRKELGNPFVLRITAPLWLLKLLCICGEQWMTITGKPVVLNKDKYNILSQRDWTCDCSEAIKDLEWKPEWNLERGVKETIGWYKANKWL